MTTTQTGTTVVLPSLGENVTEATITRWLKARGDRVEAGEPLLEVATDKVDTEVPSPAAGTLLEIVAPEDTVVEVGAAMAILGPQCSDPQDTPAPAAAPEGPAPTSLSNPAPLQLHRLPQVTGWRSCPAFGEPSQSACSNPCRHQRN